MSTVHLANASDYLNKAIEMEKAAAKTGGTTTTWKAFRPSLFCLEAYTMVCELATIFDGSEWEYKTIETQMPMGGYDGMKVKVHPAALWNTSLNIGVIYDKYRHGFLTFYIGNKDDFTKHSSDTYIVVF